MTPPGSCTSIPVTGPTFAERFLPDTGTTLSYIPEDAFYAILDYFPDAVPEPGLGYTVDCSHLNDEGTIDFAFGDFTIHVPYREFIFQLPPLFTWESPDVVCVVGAVPSESFFILGDTFLRATYGIYPLNPFSLRSPTNNSATALFSQQEHKIYLAQYENCGTSILSSHRNLAGLVGNCGHRRFPQPEDDPPENAVGAGMYGHPRSPGSSSSTFSSSPSPSATGFGTCRTLSTGTYSPLYPSSTDIVDRHNRRNMFPKPPIQTAGIGKRSLYRPAAASIPAAASLSDDGSDPNTLPWPTGLAISPRNTQTIPESTRHHNSGHARHVSQSTDKHPTTDSEAGISLTATTVEIPAATFPSTTVDGTTITITFAATNTVGTQGGSKDTTTDCGSDSSSSSSDASSDWAGGPWSSYSSLSGSSSEYSWTSTVSMSFPITWTSSDWEPEPSSSEVASSGGEVKSVTYTITGVSTILTTTLVVTLGPSPPETSTFSKITQSEIWTVSSIWNSWSGSSSELSWSTYSSGAPLETPLSISGTDLSSSTSFSWESSTSSDVVTIAVEPSETIIVERSSTTYTIIDGFTESPRPSASDSIWTSDTSPYWPSSSPAGVWTNSSRQATTTVVFTATETETVTAVPTSDIDGYVSTWAWTASDDFSMEVVQTLAPRADPLPNPSQEVDEEKSKLMAKNEDESEKTICVRAMQERRNLVRARAFCRRVLELNAKSSSEDVEHTLPRYLQPGCLAEADADARGASQNIASACKYVIEVADAGIGGNIQNVFDNKTDDVNGDSES